MIVEAMQYVSSPSMALFISTKCVVLDLFRPLRSQQGPKFLFHDGVGTFGLNSWCLLLLTDFIYYILLSGCFGQAGES